MTDLPVRRWALSRHVAAIQIEPLLASWNASDDPAQIRLQEYLDRVESVLAASVGAAPLLALHVDVRLPPGTDLLRHNDLENYLTPLAQRLRFPTLARASATKALRTGGESSSVQLWDVEPAEADDGRWYVVTPTGSTSTKTWKASLRSALLDADVPEEMPGPLSLEVAFRCSPGRRNWVNLWKPAGDALGPLLGEPDLRNPFNPADDRVVELALHLDPDDTMGNDVRIAVRCGPTRCG
jgi:hypothetical protein